MSYLSNIEHDFLGRLKRGLRQSALVMALMTSLSTSAMLSTALAQDAAGDEASVVEAGLDDVLASVDGNVITESDLIFAAEDLAQDLASVPPGEQRAFLISVLIDMKVMANAARALELNETDTFQRRESYLIERALRRAYFVSVVNAQVTDESIQAAYEELVGEQDTQIEVHARHILLASEEDAALVIAEIEAGRDFQDAAREKSTGPSGPNGGDLGFFGRGQMVAEFEDAVFALEVGQVSAPIETQFGWHVILVEEQREIQPISFEQAAPQLRQRLLIEAFETGVENLKAEAVIEIMDPLLAPADAEPTNAE